MGSFKTGWKWRLLGGLVVVTLPLAAAAWLKGPTIAGWYYVHGLSRAGDDAERELWQARIHRLGRPGLSLLLDGLQQADPRACANIGQTLIAFPSDQVGSVEVATGLAEVFPRLRGPGQEAALGILVECLRRPTAPAGEASPGVFLPAIARLLAAAAQSPDRDVHAGALRLAEAAVGGNDARQLRDSSRELVRTCVQSENISNRIRAVRLAQSPSLDLVDQIVPLLNDPTPEVRQAALLALGPAPEVLATDDLLQWLHDPDPGVRKLCETALRGRGLPDLHLQLGRFLTDSRPANRMQVLDLLQEAADLEPGVWLRRLSHDRVPAVRAAAVRAAGEQQFVDLSDRLEQMAQNDPSPTVRQLARYYLNSPKRRPR